MTTKMVTNPNGTCSRVIRDDAVKHQGRYIVPTIYGQADGNTKWVSTWEEFRAAGGNAAYNEGQTEIELLLPEGYKFSIGFMERR